MKSRIWLLAGGALVALLAFLFWRQHERAKIVSNSEQPVIESPSNPAPITQGAQVTTNSAQTSTLPIQTAPAPTPQDRQARIELARTAIEGMNQPISFHGRVIDQDSNSLAGVKIQARIRHWEPQSFGGSIPMAVETDSDGRFHLQGATGDGVDIEAITKDRYDLEPTPRGFGGTSGSPENPVTFKMWNTNIHETLVSGQKAFPITPDGRPYIIDLTKGTISESGEGDLKVWVKRPDPITRGQRYDWSCGIDVLNGGLSQDDSPGGAMFQAPTEGYTHSFAFEQKVGSGWGDSTGIKRFYLLLDNGKKYGRMSIELCAFYNRQNPGMIRVEYAVNPSGSRILR